ncbi:YtcA family lipoprotein [Burkholderia orbicola]|uniref:YtcA family lipoprotein n=1 Tax=Burkholderia orbicola TaxID=2978683 RepID=UPI003AF78BF9
MKCSNRVRQANESGQSTRETTVVVALVSLSLSGCTRAPSIVLFGAAFPDWLFCIAGGVLATIFIHFILSVKRCITALEPLPLSYPGLTAIFAVSIWLLIFYH